MRSARSNKGERLGMTRQSLLPLVSVIIPTHDRSALLQQAVESVLAQTYPNLEVIVVDDGSADDTAAVMARYDGRLHYIRQANQGVAAARNAGYRAAAGEYLAFLDDDDLYLAHKIERQVRLLSDQSHLGLVHCRYYRADGEGNYLDKVGLLPTGDARELLLYWNFVWIGGPLIRRTCLERVGLFSLDVPSVTADWDLWLRVALAGYHFGCVQEPLGVYRVHAESMMSDVAGVEQGTMAVLDKAFADPAQPSDVAITRPHALSIIHFWLGCLYYGAGQWDDGRRHMAAILDLSPQLLRQHSNISQVLCNIALSHRISDPEQFVNDVLDHLPDHAIDLQQYRLDILCNLYIRMAMQNYGRGDIALAKSQLRRVFDPACAAPIKPEILVKCLTYAAIHLPVPSPVQYINTVLDNLPVEAADLSRIRVRALNKVHIKLSREALMAGKRWQAVRHYICALRYRPFSIYDRRTASLWLKVLVSR
jgi:hypothetical protein